MRGLGHSLGAIARESGELPLSWSGLTPGQTNIDIGAALNPIIVSWLSGKPVRRVAFDSPLPRLIAGGMTGQIASGGEVWFWGTGCSPYVRQSGVRRLFRANRVPARTILATRGPISGALLGGGALESLTFGDPLSLMPRIVPRPAPPRWELGVVPHATDRADLFERSASSTQPARYKIPDSLASAVRLLDPAPLANLAAVGARLNELLDCRRILTACPSVLIIAESYGIPCLYFPDLGSTRHTRIRLEFGERIDVEVLDYAMGIGRTVLDCYDQRRDKATDWEAAIKAIDDAWTPSGDPAKALVTVFPADLAPLSPPDDGPIWDHPLLTRVNFVQDPAAMRRAEAEAFKSLESERHSRRQATQKRLRLMRVPATAVAARAPSKPQWEAASALPLSWAAGSDAAGAVNIGDALSPLIVSAISGRSVRHAAFDSTSERIAAVGTIAHGQRNGVVHFWGSGLDEKNGANGAYTPPARTQLHVHAMRGPISAGVLRMHGTPAPEVYGDPVYFLPKILPLEGVEKTYDLGVILHLSELAPEAVRSSPHQRARPKPEHLRYVVPRSYRERIRLIDTRASASLKGFRDKVAEIASCRAILSTSLHGLVIADAYGVPNAWFAFNDHGLHHVDPLNPNDRIDHRVRDLYAGLGESRAQVYGARRDATCDWDAALGVMLNEIAPRTFEMRSLLEAFPGPIAVAFDDDRWSIPSDPFEKC